MSLLEDIASTTTRVAAAAGPSVTAIGRHGRGSGIVIAPGAVLTNAHNLRDRTTAVTFTGGRQVQGTVLGADAEGDIAVLQVDTGDAPAITWHDTGSVQVGAPVLALANPGGRGPRVTFGTVSAVEQAFRGPRGRRVVGAFEHTAPLARGSSGGPVVDLDGRLLGVSTKRVGDGFYLALVADAGLRSRVEALSRGERPVRARLGVGLAPSYVANRLRATVGLPPRDGLLVQVVADGSPADHAGITRGDLLVGAEGQPVGTTDDLLDALDGVAAGGTVVLQVVRGADDREVEVRFDGPAGQAEESPDEDPVG